MRHFLILSLFTFSTAWAQSDPLPAVPPPPPGMEAFGAVIEQESPEPEVNVVILPNEVREEHRINGRLYMVKVTPTIGKPYYLVDRQGDGKFIEVEINQRPVKPPMWVIHSW